MNLKAHHINFRQLCIVAAVCSLICMTGAVALAEDTVDRLDRELKELRQKINLMVSVPVGTIMAYGGDLNDGKVKDNLISQGWLPCDGAPYSSDDKSGYTDLYRVIGTAFGGDKDKGTFNVPNLRGRFVRGTDSGTGMDPDAKSRAAGAPGGNTGDNVGSIQEDAFQGHYHFTNAGFGNDGTRAGIGRHITAVGAAASVGAAINDNVHGEPKLSKETRPKNVNVHWIIKARSENPNSPEIKK